MSNKIDWSKPIEWSNGACWQAAKVAHIFKNNTAIIYIDKWNWSEHVESQNAAVRNVAETVETVEKVVYLLPPPGNMTSTDPYWRSDALASTRVTFTVGEFAEADNE